MPDALDPILLHATDGISTKDDRATFETVQAAVLQLWDVVDNLTRIHPPKHDRYRVTIFGSARLRPEDLLYIQVRELAGELTKMGCDIVTGGGPGLMQAANEGSVSADPQNLTQSIGVRITLEHEQQTNPFVEEVYQHRTFFSRLHHFVLLSDAFVVVPGGIGTTLETMMIWQLLQVRQLHHVPLILVGSMWADLVQWAKVHMMEVTPSFVSPVDIGIPTCVETYEEAIALLQKSQSQWQNSRVVTSQQFAPETL
ncbi:LOG family protein [Pseudanabaena sp. PCC 6802]|uniref:LOG family protein n=1 Tax=Pseudanabaena sp. PCC 6802 TaxID=118173 RepID=UPI000345FEC2|nr:LOG family protein [Pseudanabaena sp. PCC 6802]